MSYVRKLGASALVIAAAFAVAFAVLVSSTTTQTVEAKTVTLTDTTVDAEPGDKVVIPGASEATIVDFSITGGTASGSFASGGGQSVSCSDSITTPARGCDVMDGAGIQVELNVDADSADGYILVKRDVILPTNGTDDTVVITVTTQPQPASLTATATAKTIDANGAITSVGNAGRTQIVATVKNDQSPAAGMNGQRVTFITTLGVMNCPASTDADGGNAIAEANYVQWCQVWTTGRDNPATTAIEADGDAGFDGHAVVSLLQSGREGTATVTVTHGTLDATTVDVTLYGTAKNLEAEADQSSVEIGGSVFVVLTVTDAAGNPVRNAQPQPASEDPIVAPTKESNKVTTSQAADDNDAATSPYNVNKDPKITADATTNAVSKDKGDLPSCGAFVAVAHTPNAVGRFASTGTDDAGQCAVQVNATADTPGTATNEASARGVHTLTFEIGDDITASVEITVAGGPATISSDAPDYVDELSDTTITVTVRDDEGVLVGETDINVIQVSGDGLTEGAATMMDATTKNGSATFSYAAGLAGDVVLRVIAGSGDSAIRDIITLSVGMPAEEPEPSAPSLSLQQVTTQGTSLATFSGGSIDELGSALEAACGAGGAAWALDQYGDWKPYRPSAPSLVNRDFNAIFSAGVPAGTVLFISGCGN